MKKKTIAMTGALFVVAAMGFALASNKAEINKAAKQVKENPVIPVKAYTVREDSLRTSFSINGTTAPIREVKIASEVQGKLTSLFVDNGDVVKAGQVIATLDAAVPGAQLRSIEASIAKADHDLKRYRNLIQLGGATPMQAESAQLQINSLLAEKKQVLDQIAHMQIRAPFSGRVESLSVELGSFVSYGTVLASLIDNSSLKVRTFLSEQEAAKVKTGQAVTIRSAVLTKPKPGKLSMVSAKADASGKFLAEISFANTDQELLKSGVLVDVDLSADGMAKGLFIPAAALTGSVKDTRVFTIKGTRVERRIVRTGIVTADKVQVLQGLQAGEQVVTSGQLNLENGTTVSVNN